MSVIKHTAFKDCCIRSCGLPFFGPILLKSAEHPSTSLKTLMEMQNKDSIFQVQIQVGVEDVVGLIVLLGIYLSYCSKKSKNYFLYCRVHVQELLGCNVHFTRCRLFGMLK